MSHHHKEEFRLNITEFNQLNNELDRRNFRLTDVHGKVIKDILA